ncbi:FKBP-type peptidyl-prolyl cis-trans isomerase [Marilutibacter alkalisoli]|nr:FKBP-type peptidyl-prolyl cis-trans isomerase [Lysobacter alkalisoli]
MSFSVRTLSAAMAATTLGLALAACTPSGGDDASADAATQTADGEALDIEGLKGSKAQAGYMIGMEVARTLEPVQEEIDADALFMAIRDSLAGKPMLMTDEQAAQVAEQLGQRVTDRIASDNAEEGRKFLAENGSKEGITTTESGLQYEVISEGDGPRPKADDTVRVHYTGTLLDGTVFDDSTARGEPVVFPLEQVVPGWSEGLTLMPVGSKYRLWIPSELGYGEMGTPGGPIAPNATLVFEVELLGIEAPPADR